MDTVRTVMLHGLVLAELAVTGFYSLTGGLVLLLITGVAWHIAARGAGGR